MSLKSDPDMGINSWLEDELYQQYLHDRTAVDEEWKHLFEQSNGVTKPSPAATSPAPEPPAFGDLQPLRGIAGKIAENMSASVAVPLATSQRTIAVKVMDENRRTRNQHRTLILQAEVSSTRKIEWPFVKAPVKLAGI